MVAAAREGYDPAVRRSQYLKLRARRWALELTVTGSARTRRPHEKADLSGYTAERRLARERAISRNYWKRRRGQPEEPLP